MKVINWMANLCVRLRRCLPRHHTPADGTNDDYQQAARQSQAANRAGTQQNTPVPSSNPPSSRTHWPKEVPGRSGQSPSARGAGCSPPARLQLMEARPGKAGPASLRGEG